MHKYVIEGSHPLSGKIHPCGKKNAALPCLAATLLTDESVVLKNIPDLEDVRVMIEILRGLGFGVEKTGASEYTIVPSDVGSGEIPVALAKKIRASILLAGPLLARRGKVNLPPPGGDVIGRFRLTTVLPAPSANSQSVGTAISAKLFKRSDSRWRSYT